MGLTLLLTLVNQLLDDLVDHKLGQLNFFYVYSVGRQVDWNGSLVKSNKSYSMYV